MLSAVIIARDEADRIGDAVRSVAFADEVLVLDSGSADETVAVAEAAGARVLRTDWPGFVAQKNRAWQAARGDWVLAIDADERVPDALRAEILAALRHPRADAFSFPRRNHWLGHPLAWGHAWPDRKLRLARRECARWEGRDPHDRLVAAGTVAPLHNELTHHSWRSLSDHLQKLDRYSQLDARRGSWPDILARPLWHFVSGYLLRLGLLDGLPGLAFALLGAVGVFLKYARWRF